MASIKKVTIGFPEQTISNDDLQREFPDSNFETFEKKVGVQKRRIAEPGETALDLSVRAAEELLKGEDRDSIDFILYCTQTPDFLLPGNAGLLQDRLNFGTQIGALDFNLGCSGYVYGLSIAKGLLATGAANRVLFITADTYSRIVHPKDRVNRSLFGDAATATLIERSGDGIGQFRFGTDGSGCDKLYIRNGGMRFEAEPDAELFEFGTGNYTDNNHLLMNGLEVFGFTTRVVPEVVSSTLEANNCTIDEIDYFILHQANEYILRYLQKKLGIPDEKFYLNMKEVGNTSSSTIPIGLEESVQNGTLKKGHRVMLVGYGIGLSWGGVVINI